MKASCLLCAALALARTALAEELQPQIVPGWNITMPPPMLARTPTVGQVGTGAAVAAFAYTIVTTSPLGLPIAVSMTSVGLLGYAAEPLVGYVLAEKMLNAASMAAVLGYPLGYVLAIPFVQDPESLRREYETKAAEKYAADLQRYDREATLKYAADLEHYQREAAKKYEAELQSLVGEVTQKYAVKQEYYQSEADRNRKLYAAEQEHYQSEVERNRELEVKVKALEKQLSELSELAATPDDQQRQPEQLEGIRKSKKLHTDRWHVLALAVSFCCLVISTVMLFCGERCNGIQEEDAEKILSPREAMATQTDSSDALSPDAAAAREFAQLLGTCQEEWKAESARVTQEAAALRKELRERLR